MPRDIRNMPLRAGDASYNAALETLKARAADPNHSLSYFDDTRRGSKNTECTLGLCDDSIEESIDGVYFREARHTCPHDARYFDGQGTRITPPQGTNTINGCFYTCRIFNPSKTMKKRAGKEREYLARQRVLNATLIPVELVASNPADEPDEEWED